MVVPHKKNIPGIRRHQLKLIANRSLSGNLLVISKTDSELASVDPTRESFIPYAEESLPEKARECLTVQETW